MCGSTGTGGTAPIKFRLKGLNKVVSYVLILLKFTRELHGPNMGTKVMRKYQYYHYSSIERVNLPRKYSIHNVNTCIFTVTFLITRIFHRGDEDLDLQTET